MNASKAWVLVRGKVTQDFPVGGYRLIRFLNSVDLVLTFCTDWYLTELFVYLLRNFGEGWWRTIIVNFIIHLTCWWAYVFFFVVAMNILRKRRIIDYSWNAAWVDVCSWNFTVELTIIPNCFLILHFSGFRRIFLPLFCSSTKEN